jgi:hypothetical protein
MTTLALLSCALLFGGMVLYSFGFAAFLFTALPAETAGPTIRRAFPHFYLFVIGGAALSAVFLWFLDPPGAAIMAAIALTTIPTRQILMPAINAATDAGDKRRFGLLHGLSVVITLIHIGAAAYVLHRFIG